MIRKKTNNNDVKSIATALTINDSENEELKKQWRELELLVQIVEKETFKMNLETITQMLQEVKNLNARIDMLERYTGALKNQFEDYTQTQSHTLTSTNKNKKRPYSSKQIREKIKQQKDKKHNQW